MYLHDVYVVGFLSFLFSLFLYAIGYCTIYTYFHVDIYIQYTMYDLSCDYHVMQLKRRESSLQQLHTDNQALQEQLAKVSNEVY